MEKEIKEPKKGGNNVVLILAMLIILCLVGYICYDKILAPADKTNTSTNSEVKKANNTKADTCDCDCEEETQEEVSNVKHCDGEYYGEYTGGNYLIKGTYRLNKDGSYSSYFENSEGYSGEYVIFGKTLIIAHKSNYEDSYIVEEPLEIAEDCSYIISKLDASNEMKFTKK